MKEDELTADDKEELLSEATVLLKDQSNAVLRLSEKMIEKKSIDILLSNLKQSVIILDDSDRKISAIHIKNIEDCVIFCGSIDGSVLIYGITNSILVVDCHQVNNIIILYMCVCVHTYSFHSSCVYMMHVTWKY